MSLVHPEVVDRVRHRDGSWRWLESTARAFTTPEGHQHVLLVGRDVTTRIEATQQLQQAQKLESLAVLAGGIAHDFNNLLAVILGNADVARDTLPEGSKVRAPLEEVASAAECARDLTQPSTSSRHTPTRSWRSWSITSCRCSMAPGRCVGIRRLSTRVPVVVTSGVAAEPFYEGDGGRTTFLPKPYRTQRLADEVFAALDRDAGSGRDAPS